MQNLSLFSIVALSAAGILPPLAAGFMYWHAKKCLRQMDTRLQQMREIETGMREMLAAPARIRQMAQEMRDSVTRIQEMP